MENKVELNGEIDSDLKSGDIGQNNMITSGAIKNDYTPKIYQYLLGALGFVVTIFVAVLVSPTSSAWMESSFYTLIIVMVIPIFGTIIMGGIGIIVLLNYNTGCLISYYAQKMMRKISFNEKYAVLFVILINVLYQLICILLSNILLLSMYDENVQFTSCMDTCVRENVTMNFVMIVIIVVLNITTLVASINKLDSRQKKKKVRNKK